MGAAGLERDVELHLLMLDGAHRTEGVAAPVFRPVCAPRAQELQGLVEQIALRIGRTLEKRGLIERARLERLCRYVSRPPVASERLALTASGEVRDTLKTPYRDGTTQLVLEPLELMARLAARVPPPRRTGAVPG